MHIDPNKGLIKISGSAQKKLSEFMPEDPATDQALRLFISGYG